MSQKESRHPALDSWCVQQGTTPSNGPGPTAGNPNPYLYHEEGLARFPELFRNLDLPFLLQLSPF